MESPASSKTSVFSTLAFVKFVVGRAGVNVLAMDKLLSFSLLEDELDAAVTFSFGFKASASVILNKLLEALWFCKAAVTH